MDRRREVVERLLYGYERFYTITRFDQPREDASEKLCEAKEIVAPFLKDGAKLVSICEYYEAAKKYFLFKTNSLWETEQEEFILLFSVPKLTKSVLHECLDFAYHAGRDMAHIGPGHMYTFVTPVFVCDEMDEEARKEIEGYRYFESFCFSFHGWLEFHVAAICGDKFYFNRAGRSMEKELRRVMSHQSA